MVTCPFCGDLSCDMIHTLDEDASKIVGFPYQVPSSQLKGNPLHYQRLRILLATHTLEKRSDLRWPLICNRPF